MELWDGNIINSKLRGEFSLLSEQDDSSFVRIDFDSNFEKKSDKFTEIFQSVWRRNVILRLLAIWSVSSLNSIKCEKKLAGMSK